MTGEKNFMRKGKVGDWKNFFSGMSNGFLVVYACFIRREAASAVYFVRPSVWYGSFVAHSTSIVPWRTFYACIWKEFLTKTMFTKNKDFSNNN